MKKNLLIAFIVIFSLLSIIAISGCQKDETNNNPKSKIAGKKKNKQLKDRGKNDQPTTKNYDPNTAPPLIKALYTYAAENRDLLKNFYCVCGCMGPMHKPSHKSLADCYIKEIKPNGEVVYDSHGTYCKACQDEAFDVKLWTIKGKKLAEVKKLFDAKYSKAPGAPRPQ